MSARFNNRFIAYSLLLLNSALWGFSPPIIKYALTYVSPATFLFTRYLIATTLFFPIFLIYKTKHPQKHNPKHLLLLAILGTPLTLVPLFYGLQATTSIEASILESISPIFIVLGSLVYLRESVRPREWLGILLALTGTIFITIQPFFDGSSLNSLSIKGNLLIIFSDIIWACFLIAAKYLKSDPIYLSFTSFIVSIPIFLFLALQTHSPLLPPLIALPSILYMAIAGSIIAFWAYQEGQKRIEASEAAIFSYLKPIFTIPLAFLWLREPLSPITILATIVIISGVYLSEKR